MKKLSLIALLLSTQVLAAPGISGLAKVHAYAGAGNKGMPVPTRCEYYAEVTNTGNAPKWVWVSYIYNPQGQKIQNTRYKIKVNHGTWHDNFQIERNDTYKYAGHYRLECSTVIDEITSKTDVNDVSIA